jgi:hypothetical protein
MAQRRMFSMQVVESDQFLEMPLTSQSLYFHLGMYADDDGFVTPNKVMRMIGATSDDLKILAAKQFIIPFESGVIVIRHWKENNYIQSDRYKPTSFTHEKAKLLCIQNVYNVDTQVRLGKDRLGEDRKGKDMSSTNVEGQPQDKRSPDVQELWDYGLSIGFQPTKQSGNRYAITRLIKSHGKDLTKKYAHYSQAIRQHQYAPQINNWMDLEEKLLKLRDFAERQKKKSQRIVNIDL